MLYVEYIKTMVYKAYGGGEGLPGQQSKCNIPQFGPSTSPYHLASRLRLTCSGSTGPDPASELPLPIGLYTTFYVGETLHR